jgi:hypothetical protein
MTKQPGVLKECLKRAGRKGSKKTKNSKSVRLERYLGRRDSEDMKDFQPEYVLYCFIM